MTIMLKTMMWAAMAIVLVFAGFAIGFPVGQHRGFATGTEWAIVQVDILAREAHVTLPVDFEEGAFRVIVRQPPDLSRQAWRLAERHDTMMERGNGTEKKAAEKVDFSPAANLVP